MYVVVNTHGNAHLQIKGDREKEAEKKRKEEEQTFKMRFVKNFIF